MLRSAEAFPVVVRFVILCELSFLFALQVEQQIIILRLTSKSSIAICKVLRKSADQSP